MKRRFFALVILSLIGAGLLALWFDAPSAKPCPVRTLAGELGDVNPIEGQKSRG